MLLTIFTHCFLLVQYTINLYQYFKEWRKNPHWSFSCCLALLLTLNELQGEIGRLSETNMLNNQLDTGEFSVPTLIGAVKDSGAIDVKIEENEEGDDVTAEVHCSYQNTECKKKRSHQGTQTNPFSLPIADIRDHEPFEEAHMNTCKYNARTS